MSAQPTYDERREKLTPCACGRLVTNPPACVSAGTCLLGERETQIAGIAERQRARREGLEDTLRRMQSEMAGAAARGESNASGTSYEQRGDQFTITAGARREGAA